MNYFKLAFPGTETYTLGDTLTVTPEWLAQALTNTPRPEGYKEGDVSWEFTIAGLVRFFGETTLSQVPAREFNEWHNSL